jgi:ABC-2 type transport system ATP-binding protein
MNLLEVNGLCKRYSGFVLDNVSFSLEPGYIMGFIGRNGAGKTTTIKSMLNLIKKDGGEVYINGLPFDKNETECKRQIGFITGGFDCYKKSTLKKLTSVTRRFYDDWNDGLYREYLTRFNLDENKKVSELSAGMRVKYPLTLALCHDAKLLILDEPTSGLDPFSREELIDVFKKLRDRGTAILFSTHIISDVEKCADDVAYIRQGRLAAAMPKEEVTARFGTEGETLEETVVRLERSEADA